MYVRGHSCFDFSVSYLTPPYLTLLHNLPCRTLLQLTLPYLNPLESRVHQMRMKA